MIFEIVHFILTPTAWVNCLQCKAKIYYLCAHTVRSNCQATSAHTAPRLNGPLDPVPICLLTIVNKDLFKSSLFESEEVCFYPWINDMQLFPGNVWGRSSSEGGGWALALDWGVVQSYDCGDEGSPVPLRAWAQKWAVCCGYCSAPPGRGEEGGWHYPWWPASCSACVSPPVSNVMIVGNRQMAHRSDQNWPHRSLLPPVHCTINDARRSRKSTGL